jgi:hypothetical protein
MAAMIRVLAGLAVAGCISKPAEPGPQGVARHWEKRPGPQVPGPLFSARLAYDGHRVLLYGGGTTDQQFDAMYALGPDGWTRLCDNCLGAVDPAGAGGCFRSGFAYDSTADRIVLFGGEGPGIGAYRDGLWQYRGDAWTFAGHGVPSPRTITQLVDDPGLGGLRLLGGYDPGALADSWTLVGSTWVEDPTPPDTFMTADGMEATFDADRDSALVLADAGGNGNLDEVWQHDGAGWSRLCEGCTGMPRTAASLVHVPVYDQTFLIGGSGGTGPDPVGTWIRVGNTFERYVTSADLPNRSYTGVIYDPDRDVVVLYGGRGDDCTLNFVCDETWELVRD